MLGHIKVHVDNKGIIDGLRRGERECIKPQAGDADLWIKIWEELHSLAARGMAVEVEHVKAHRTKKDKKKMSRFEKFLSEGNEKAYELGQRFHGGSESKDSAARARRGVRSLAACSQLSLLSREKSESIWTRKKEETKHRTEWCGSLQVSCGKSSK